MENIKKDLGSVRETKERKTYHVNITLDGNEEGQEPVELSYRFKEPTPIQFNRYVKELSKDTIKAAKNLVLSNIFAEDKEKLQEDLEKYPGLLLTITPKFMAMMGVTDNVTFHRIEH
ncbi:MAG: hypothetical protein Q4A78_07415 [Peptostreptococcaceae bacterium]|nr:hypothetical protein [Peptostreptococcaceae bacterium]